jgi:hypothetical protein
MGKCAALIKCRPHPDRYRIPPSAPVKQRLTELDTTIAEAVTGLRRCGYSWAGIASRFSITRQAAQQRWGQR